jgi:hypothetical protein
MADSRSLVMLAAGSQPSLVPDGVRQPIQPTVADCERLFVSGRVQDALEAVVGLIEGGNPDPEARALYEKAAAIQCKVLRNVTHIEGYAVSRCLGIGREGAVYITVPQGGERRVLKIFHRHRRPRLHGTLHRVSAHLKAARHPVETLYSFDVLERDGAILGISYPYEPLIAIYPRHLALPEVPLAVIGAFLRTQGYLVRTLGMCVIDQYLGNFMMNRHGVVRYIDYGRWFAFLDDPRCSVTRDHVWALVGFVRQLFAPARRLSSSTSDVRSDEDATAGLADLVKRHEWLRPLSASIEAGRFSDFDDPDYYASLAGSLPQRVGLASRSIVAISNSISQLKRAAVR